jgi:uncharacterized protein (DUF849 family)
MDPLIISVAVTGGEHGREATPHVPVTPAEIVESAYEAHLAGAAVVHVDVRDDDERPVHDPARYAYVANELRERCEFGRPVATPQDARRILGLKGVESTRFAAAAAAGA